MLRLLHPARYGGALHRDGVRAVGPHNTADRVQPVRSAASRDPIADKVRSATRFAHAPLASRLLPLALSGFFFWLIFLGEKWLCSIAKQLLQAVTYLHDHGHVHCDIKPQNILYKSSPTEDGKIEIRLADFGSCIVDTGDCNDYIVTRPYRPPEVRLAAGCWLLAACKPC